MAKYTFKPTDASKLQEKYDLIVIGSGGAGLTSALQAEELGLKPVILEKMRKLGGNTTRASSGMNASETEVQVNHKVIDDMQAFYDETYDGGGRANNEVLLKYFVTHSALAINWLAQHNINLDDLTLVGGMTRPRTHRPHDGAPVGGYLVTELLKQIDKAKVPVFEDAEVTELLQDNDGTITGVKATVNGNAVQIEAAAVILATGGFGANAEMISKVRPDLANYRTTNHEGATGDGIALAEKAGALLTDMDQIQVHPTVQQDTDHAYLIGEAVRGEGAILVNSRGERFTNELATRDKVTAAIDELPEKSAYLILDQAVYDRVPAMKFYDSIGLVKHGATISVLAKEIGVPANLLEWTRTEWNVAVNSKGDSKYKRSTGMHHELKNDPYYAVHISPAVHYTMGGVAINDKAQVLNTECQVIRGLFAAGEIAGGLHGHNRIGGNSIAETVIFGRQAGKQAYKYLG